MPAILIAIQFIVVHLSHGVCGFYSSVYVNGLFLFLLCFHYGLCEVTIGFGKFGYSPHLKM